MSRNHKVPHRIIVWRDWYMRSTSKLEYPNQHLASWSTPSPPGLNKNRQRGQVHPTLWRVFLECYAVVFEAIGVFWATVFPSWISSISSIKENRWIWWARKGRMKSLIGEQISFVQWEIEIEELIWAMWVDGEGVLVARNVERYWALVLLRLR